jgi:hypothetical protein
MKTTNAFSKLTRNGWKIEKRSQFYFKATKDESYIFLHVTSADEVTEVRYGKEGHAAKVALNLTAAMKLLGDVPARKYDSESRGSMIPIPANICRQFVDFDTGGRPTSAFPSHYLKSLNVRTKSQVDDLFSETFKQELAPRKRHSYSRQTFRELIDRKRGLMWSQLVKLFEAENPDLPPLRIVRITTKVPGYEEFERNYGWQTPTVKQAVAGVFSTSPEDACRTVRLMLGEFARVDGGEIVAIGPHEEAFDAFQKTYAVSAQDQEICNLKKAQDAVKQAELTLETTKRLVEMQEKKIETAQFIDSIAMLSSMNSSDRLDFGNVQDKQ